MQPRRALLEQSRSIITIHKADVWRNKMTPSFMEVLRKRFTFGPIVNYSTWQQVLENFQNKRTSISSVATLTPVFNAVP